MCVHVCACVCKCVHVCACVCMCVHVCACDNHWTHLCSDNHWTQLCRDKHWTHLCSDKHLSGQPFGIASRLKPSWQEAVLRILPCHTRKQAQADTKQAQAGNTAVSNGACCVSSRNTWGGQMGWCAWNCYARHTTTPAQLSLVPEAEKDWLAKPSTIIVQDAYTSQGTAQANASHTRGTHKVHKRHTQKGTSQSWKSGKQSKLVQRSIAFGTLPRLGRTRVHAKWVNASCRKSNHTFVSNSFKTFPLFLPSITLSSIEFPLRISNSLTRKYAII